MWTSKCAENGEESGDVFGGLPLCLVGQQMRDFIRRGFGVEGEGGPGDGLEQIHPCNNSAYLSSTRVRALLTSVTTLLAFVTALLTLTTTLLTLVTTLLTPITTLLVSVTVPPAQVTVLLTPVTTLLTPVTATYFSNNCAYSGNGST